MVALLTFPVPTAHTGWDMHGDFGGGWGVVMMIGMILFWAAIIVLAVWLVRGAAGPRAHEQKNPLEILQLRLAQGEISVEDYDRLREKLASPD